MSRTVRVNAQGETWCHHRSWKRTYSTIEEAWLAAFLFFVTGGSITTPYRCGRSKRYVGEARVRITANPYAYDPFVRYIGRRRVRVQGCGMWHLTSSTSHALPSPDGLWNAAGAYVGPDRQCIRADGFPKKIFKSEHDARAFLNARNMHALAPYLCARNHWHVGANCSDPLYGDADA